MSLSLEIGEVELTELGIQVRGKVMCPSETRKPGKKVTVGRESMSLFGEVLLSKRDEVSR